MADGKRNPGNRRINLKTLRRHLKLSQERFIQRFLTDENGVSSISIATLSNLESKGGVRLNSVILEVSEQLALDTMLFSMDPEEFQAKINILLPSEKTTKQIRATSTKRGNINQLLHRLTMYLSDQLLTGERKKGDKIESDRVLADKMEVGRSAIREALKVLDVLGMIEVRPGQGTYISNDESSFFIIPLVWSLFLNGSQVESIIEIRNLLEVKAAGLAAKNENPIEREKLNVAMGQIRSAFLKKDVQAFLESDIEFHTAIAECSENQVIHSMILAIRNLMLQVSETGMLEEQQISDIYEEHQEIYQCILSHDSFGAELAMKKHLTFSAKRYQY